MPHGIMFHHFHDAFHPQGQGSITAEHLMALLRSYQPGQWLDADDWLERAKTGTLEPQHRCVTFDDALLCQYDVAVPVLKQLGITAFWFVYSSVLQGNREPLEIYRLFRTVAFPSVEAFYRAFFKTATERHPRCQPHLSSPTARQHLAAFSFYTVEDRIFRYLRDEVLSTADYAQIMDAMMDAHGFDVAAAARQLWMRDAHLLELHRAGHRIGLHSHSHPTRLDRLPRAEQFKEYFLNHTHLTRLLGERPRAMAHPCNAYNADTLEILQELGVEIGFRSNRATVAHRTLLELPREDHVNLLPGHTGK
ncbi:MAG: polysaccharide deacetylase family protein [Magnetococcales bacterium]|nr:polysaccharide deacetylase family protein [Magnetococcales bacterium]